MRALVVGALFYPYLVYIAGDPPGQAAGVTLFLVVIMIPLGLLLERLRYRLQRRRWERARAR